MKMLRKIVWFSCGAPSACLAKIACSEYKNVSVVYCNTSADEHGDNGRFMRDVENWIGQKVEIISSEKYRSVDHVFSETRYMSGIHGARCTTEMKKIPRFEFQQPDDVHLFGFTADEEDRVQEFTQNNPELQVEWPLIQKGLTKRRCLHWLEDEGIELPMMYKLGYRNNNCVGCVKATSRAYWQKIRDDFPEVFKLRAERSRELGVRLVRVDGERIFLDELPILRQMSFGILENISCGPECSV